MDVIVLCIEHKYGKNVYTCANEEIMRKRLYEYVQGEWSREIGSRSIPINPDIAISEYFQELEGYESYEFYETSIDTGESEGVT